MELFDGYYYKSCKKFMEVIGIWPYLSDRRRKISSFTFYIVNMSLVLPTYIELQQKFGKDFNVTVENFVSIMFTTGTCVKYLVAYSSINEFKTLFERIAKDWQEIPAGNEKRILAKNTEEGRFLVVFYTVYVCFAWFIYSNMPFLPHLFDVLFPLNESRPLLMPFFGNYIFFDQNKHHSLSCLHLGVVYMSNLFLFAGVDTTYVITVKHTCGLFAIISYRLESLLAKNEKGDIISLVNDKALFKQMRDIVILHKNSIKCAELLEESFSTSFLIVNSLCMFGLAIIICYVLFIFNEFLKTFRIVTFTVGVVINLLFVNWVGQMIIDYSEKVFISTYYSNWYFAPNGVRKMTSIMMHRALYPCQLTAGKLSILCLETFGKLTKASMSYTTVFLSVM